MTAHRAFQFCKQYKRTTEFRRLCEIIRNHLANLNKYRDQRDRPDLNAPESLQLYLDTRFEQLKMATELELWQVCIFLFASCVDTRINAGRFTHLEVVQLSMFPLVGCYCFPAGSFSFCGRYTWIDVHG